MTVKDKKLVHAFFFIFMTGFVKEVIQAGVFFVYFNFGFYESENVSLFTDT